MTKLKSIPESQLTALTDLILETAADLEQKKGSDPPAKRISAPERWPTKAISILTEKEIL